MDYDVLSFFILNDYSFGLPNPFEEYTIYDLKVWSYKDKYQIKTFNFFHTLNGDASLDMEA